MPIVAAAGTNKYGYLKHRSMAYPRAVRTNSDVACANLFRGTHRTVAEIAAACGFADHNSFARAFRKVAGISPTQFRETA